jgi:hypothetical protein
MAVILGFIPVGADGNIVNTALSLGLRAFGFDEWPGYEDAVAANFVSPITSNAPVSAVPRVVVGDIQTTFFDDFYNRIHLRPASLNLGNLASGATRTVDLWNAFLTPQLMGDFDPPADPGIQVIAPVTPPYTMPPIALLEYELTFTTDSAPTIDDEMRWTIGGIEYSLPITGRRVIAWPFLPTWDRGVDEQLEWLTSVERSYDGTEQRISLRTVARRVFEFTVRESRETAQHLENALYGWAGRLFAMPIFPEKSALTAPAASGSTTLQCATADRTFVVDGLAVLYSDDLNLEVVEVASVTPTAITTSRPTTISWAAGTRIYPAMIARVDGTTSINRQTDSVLEAPIRMVGSPGDVDPRIPTVAAPATYRGDELYTLRTNWAGGVPFDLDAEINQFDSGTGRVDIIRKADTPIAGRRHRWTLKTTAEMAAFRAWLGRRKGQAIPVWMPTGNADLTLATLIGASSLAMAVKPNRFEQFGVGLDRRKHVFIQLRSGAYFAREIVSASALPDNTISIVLDAVLGVDVAPADIKAISYLQLWRLASDNVVIAYVTDKVAVVEAVMRLA